MLEKFDIYQGQVEWKNCSDARPWIIVEIYPGDRVGCFPIASECYEGDCFPIDRDDPDFAATGLTKSCHIIWTTIYNVEASKLVKRRGKLSGPLLDGFREGSGLS